MNPKYTAVASAIDKSKFTSRSPAEIEAITKLALAFRAVIKISEDADRNLFDVNRAPR
jgi:hypothetical protein